MAYRVRFDAGGVAGNKGAYNAKEWKDLDSNGMNVHARLQIAQRWGSGEVEVRTSSFQARRRGI